MTKAPKRISVEYEFEGPRYHQYEAWVHGREYEDQDLRKDGDTWNAEYVRADLFDALTAERDALRAEAARIADDYHPEKGQEVLALSEMREAVSALANNPATHQKTAV